jgi:hypothetical protein
MKYAVEMGYDSHYIQTEFHKDSACVMNQENSEPLTVLRCNM